MKHVSPSSIRYRTRFKCRLKYRLTLEEAAARVGNFKDPDTNIYLCSECGYLHFGHFPEWLKPKPAARPLPAPPVGAYITDPVSGMLRWQRGAHAR